MKKQCTCGQVYAKVPDDAKHFVDRDAPALNGYYFNCTYCHSTMFFPDKKYVKLEVVCNDCAGTTENKSCSGCDGTGLQEELVAWADFIQALKKDW